MPDVYRFRCDDGQEHAWHGTLAALKKEHPHAVISSRLVVNEADVAAGVEQGYWVPYLGKQEGEEATSAPQVVEAPGEVVADDVTTTTAKPKTKKSEE
jgi:hypothetical protein